MSEDAASHGVVVGFLELDPEHLSASDFRIFDTVGTRPPSPNDR